MGAARFLCLIKQPRKSGVYAVFQREGGNGKVFALTQDEVGRRRANLNRKNDWRRQDARPETERAWQAFQIATDGATDVIPTWAQAKKKFPNASREIHFVPPGQNVLGHPQANYE